MDAKKALVNYRSAKDKLTLIIMQKEDAKSQVLTPEIKAQLAEIDAEFDERINQVDKELTECETLAKTAVIQAGQIVTADGVKAVYNKGRESWDSKVLEGMAIVFPDLLKARKTGDPYVTFRWG